MRRTFDELWIIDLEGDNRGARRTENVFDIQTPVAIAIGIRYGDGDSGTPADVWYTRLEGSRETKLAALAEIGRLSDLDWLPCFSGWQNPFVPIGVGDYFSWPLLTDVFPWQHSGVQVKRSWPIAENENVLRKRWTGLLRSSNRQHAFKETRDRKIANRYSDAVGHSKSLPPLASLGEDGQPSSIVRFAFRSLDRQWLIADARLIDFPRPSLWASASDRQLYLTSLLSDSLGSGPAAVVAANVPDLHHYRGSFGGKDVIPLWRDAEATEANVTQGLPDRLEAVLGQPVSPDDLFAYCYALLGSASYAERFSEELAIPGPRLPMTKDTALFRQGVALGRELVALHTYGERFADALPGGQVPRGAARSWIGIPSTMEGYPETFHFDEATQELHVGAGRFGPVAPAVWNYSVSGLQVVKSWLGYRRRRRAGRASSPLDQIRPEVWTLAMTQELLALLWTLEATIDREPKLHALLDAVVQGPLFTASELPEPSPRERGAPVVDRSSQNAQQVALGIEA